jgi:hypothetical protein
MMRQVPDPASVGDFVGDGGTDETDPLARDFQVLAADPAALERTVSRAEGYLNAYYDAQIAAYRLPPHQRPDDIPMPQPPSQSDPAERLAARLMSVFLPAVSSITAKFTQIRIQVQLLGVHAAIRRFRWEHDRLPDTLADLRLGALGVDPYTGRALVYDRIGGDTAAAVYALSSAGPIKRDEENKPMPGQRVPILLPQPPRPAQPPPAP